MRGTSLHGSPLTQCENLDRKGKTLAPSYSFPSQGNCEHTREMLTSGTAGWGLTRFKNYVVSITVTSATYPIFKKKKGQDQCIKTLQPNYTLLEKKSCLITFNEARKCFPEELT